MFKINNYIGGEWLPPKSQEYLDNVSPSTGEVFSKIPASNTEDLELAVRSAKEAFPAWSSTPVAVRSSILRKISETILAQKDSLAEAESIDTGKPLKVAASVDIPRSSANFEFFANAITQFSSESHSMDNSALNFTLRQPLGVVACISPWNLPLYLLTWKIAPALAAGNTVVAKPSEMTPLTAFLLSKICQEAGLPAGVLNILHGTGAKVGAALCEHPDVRAVSFTGSTKTGASIARSATPLFKKLSLEMGGKNATIVFADADFDKAIDGTLKAAFSNQGQICLCGSKIFVENSIYSRFKEVLIEKTLMLRVGDPLDPATDQGALVSKNHFEKVLGCISRAQKEGGKVLTGGRAVTPQGRCQNGYFIAPTLIEGLASQCPTNQEEIFGPVATLIPFDSEKDLISMANDTRYGLCASVWTQGLSRAHQIARDLRVGMVWINGWMLRDLRTPFGGTKDSGLGREGGMESLKFYTEEKNVCVIY